MKVIKNNRLFKEFGIDSLSQIPEKRLNQIAAKLQVGTMIWAEEQRRISDRGRIILAKRKVKIAKPRKTLERDIRRALTVIIEIPRDLWTKDQEVEYVSRGTEEMKEITDINPIKDELEIRLVLPPYEKTSDKKREAAMIAHVSDKVYDQYIDPEYNRITELIKDEDGRVVEKRQKKEPRVSILEDIPDEGYVVKKPVSGKPEPAKDK